MSFRSILVAAILWLSAPAFATPQPVDATGLWINPEESGWGISLVHQGNTLFGLLYVYDTNGTALWLSMSEGRQTGPRTFSGTLYASSGPAFSTVIRINRSRGAALA